MWVIAWYAPVSLFSLKPPFATTAGAKSLLVPTPYAVKMALLDIFIRIEGAPAAPAAYSTLRETAVAVAPPEHACVTNLFTKQLRPRHSGGDNDDQDGASFFQRTIAFREYVSQEGLLGLALSGPEGSAELFQKLLPQLDYLGKRGSFFQWRPPLEEYPELDKRFVVITEPARDEFRTLSTMQMVDDCDPATEFDDVSVFSERKTKRPVLHIPVPYHRVLASRSYTYYRWSNSSA